MAQSDDEKVFQQPHDGQYSSGCFQKSFGKETEKGPDRQEQCGKEGGRERKRRK